MGIKISNLPAIVTPSMTDIFAVVQGGVTYKETFNQFSSLFATAGANSNITSLSGLNTIGIVGTTTNNNADAGSVGEYLLSAVSGVVTINTTDVAQNIQSLSLTAGDWDVEFACLIQNAATVPGVTAISLSTISNTLNNTVGLGNNLESNTTGLAYIPVTGSRRISLSSTTTVYVVAVQSFSSGNPTGQAQIGARRAR
jgi:hypothetical protein